jgi:hypothetical protein
VLSIVECNETVRKNVRALLLEERDVGRSKLCGGGWVLCVCVFVGVFVFVCLCLCVCVCYYCCCCLVWDRYCGEHGSVLVVNNKRDGAGQMMFLWIVLYCYMV